MQGHLVPHLPYIKARIYNHIKGLDFSEDNNESSEKDASNKRDASNEHDSSIGFESSLGNSGVARFPLEFNNGAGCRGDAKGDPIGDKLTSHASSC